MAGRLRNLAARPMLALSQGIMPTGWVAFDGYCVGMIVHWLLSVRGVFPHRHHRPSLAQRASFILSALIGLAITVGLVVSLGSLGSPLALAKAVAVLVSFTAVYLVRTYVVFADC